MASIVGKKGEKKETAAERDKRKAQEAIALAIAKGDAHGAGQARDAALKLSEDDAANTVKSHAIEIGKALASHPDVVSEMSQTIESGEWNDYKSIAACRWLEDYLTPEQLMWLPVPGSTKADAEKALPQGSNAPLTWDIMTKTKPQTTFYKELVSSLPQGEAANKMLREVIEDKARAELNSESARWTKDRRIGIEKRANKTIERMLVAVKQAARIRIQLDKFKQLARTIRTPQGDVRVMLVEWMRDDYTGDEAVPDNVDWTRISIPGVGKVAKSTIPLRVTDGKGERKPYSIATFLNWKIEKAIETKMKAENLTREKAISKLTLGDIQEASARKQPDGKGQKPTTLEKAARFKVSGIAEFDDSINQLRSWAQGANPIEAAERVKLLQSRINSDDSTADTYETVLRILRSTGIEHPDTLERIRKYREGKAGKTA